MCNQALKRELGSRVSLIEYSKFPLKITLAEDDTLCCVDFRADTGNSHDETPPSTSESVFRAD